MKKQKFHLLYVENASSQLKSFDSKKEMEQFMKDFLSKYGGSGKYGDNWLEFSFEGNFVDFYQGYWGK